jgi:hypothetical protein
MPWGLTTVGGIALREELDARESGDGTLSIAGQESTPPSTRAHVRAAHRNVIGLYGKIVPVTFTDKADLNGYYLVSESRSEPFDFSQGSVVKTTWSMSLDRIGTERDVEFESRLSMIARTDDLPGAQVASFWHAPAPSATGYYTGSTVPGGTVVRTTDEGDLKVYTGLPATVPPRWSAPVEDYLIGSARVLLDGIRRAGDRTPDHDSWEVSNGIIRVRPTATGGIGVSMWRGVTGWSTEKVYTPTSNGTLLSSSPGTKPEFTILHNNPEEVRVRLTYEMTTAGRFQVDLSLRRGARFVTGVVKRHASANLGISRTAAETGSAFTGGLVAASADAEGVRYLLGSSKNPTSQTTATASLTRNSVLQLDFFLGAVFTAPASGDAHTDLLLQYLGTTGDETRVMPR